MFLSIGCIGVKSDFQNVADRQRLRQGQLLIRNRSSEQGLKITN